MTGKAATNRTSPNRTPLIDSMMRENHDSLLVTLKESDMANFSFPKLGRGQLLDCCEGERVCQRRAGGKLIRPSCTPREPSPPLWGRGALSGPGERHAPLRRPV